jgi:biotin carboxyl carrier protein
MKLSFLYGEEPIELRAEPDGDGWRVSLPDGSEHRIQVRRLPDDVVEITEFPERNNQGEAALPETRSCRVPFARLERQIVFSFSGDTFSFVPAADRRAVRAHKRGSGSLIAPMVGVVAEVLVQEGQTVAAYQPLAVIEAMKVMATLEAPFAGTVKTVYVQKKQRVEHGAPVVDIAPLSEEEAGGESRPAS